MKFIALIVALICFQIYSLSAGQPVDALKRYFKAIEEEDKDLLKSSIHATEVYKESFSKTIDVMHRFVLVEKLIAKKYPNLENKDRKDMGKLTGSMSRDLLKREFKITNDTARSIPRNENEIPTLFKKIGDKWLIDIQRGQSEEDLKQQAELLDVSYNAVIKMLNGLIYKVDTLDTSKYTYNQALEMVGIQVNQALDKALKEKK